MAEQQRKRVQIRNSLEEKSLEEKIRRYNREQNYVDKELRQIVQAKESLMRSLRRINLDMNVSSTGTTRRGKKMTRKENSMNQQSVERVVDEEPCDWQISPNVPNRSDSNTINTMVFNHGRRGLRQHRTAWLLWKTQIYHL
jgi:hypothetical protein